MYVCMYVMYVYIMYACMYVMYVCMYVTYACTYVCIYYVCTYVMYVCMHYVMDNMKCIRTKSARQFSQILEEVMKNEKAVRSCQKNWKQQTTSRLKQWSIFIQWHIKHGNAVAAAVTTMTTMTVMMMTVAEDMKEWERKDEVEKNQKEK
jgi:hypothetical protein